MRLLKKQGKLVVRLCHSMGAVRKSNFVSSVSAVLGLGFTLFFFPLISIGGIIAASHTANFSFNWKVTVVFLVLFNGWWYYVIYRGAMRKLAQREADKKQKVNALSKASDQ